MKRAFTAAERAALAIVQDNLPDTETPYADIAARVGLGEDEVIELLRELKAQGAIRRFGATLRHQKAGYGSNAMVAWLVEDVAEIDRVGLMFSERDDVSHCYWRRSCMDWPYTLYTMVHAKTKEDCLAAVAEMAAASGLDEYDILESRKELKKTSMRYF